MMVLVVLIFYFKETKNMLIKVQDEEGRDTDKFNKRVNFEMLVKRQKNM